MRTLCTALLLASLAGTASANGFYINEHDAKVTGRAGAVAATDTDPSAIVFNPGGLAVGEGTQVSLGASLITATGTYTDPDDVSTDTNSSPAVLPQIFASSRVHEMVAVGIGFHLPFGLAVSWPDTSPQAEVSLKSALRTYYISPAVGLNLAKQVPGLSLGAGIDLVPATVQLEQAVIFGDTRGSAVLGGDAFGVGGRLGVMYHSPRLPQLKLGAMWRSQVNLDFEGTGDFDIAAPFRSQLPPDGDISTTLKLPQAISGGVAYNPIPKLQVELNATWMNWAKFEEIRISLPDGSDLVSAQNYSNTLTVRLGGEYQINPKAAVRAGYIYDPTPVPPTTISARLPDANRHDVTLGGSYNLGNYDVHLGFLAVLPSSQKASDVQYMPVYKGEYTVKALVASLGVTGRFGR